MSQRFISEHQTFKNIQKHIKATGISRVADLSYLDDSSDIKIYSAIRPNSKALSISMGKGFDNISAKVGACMESIESYYAENLRKSDIKGSLNKIIKQKTPNINHGQYCNNISFSSNYEMDWYLATYLLDGSKCYIPKTFLSLNSNEQDNVLVGSNSSGLASGNNFSEAISSSFLEVIERGAENSKTMASIDVPDKLLMKFNLSNKLDFRAFYIENNFNLPVITVCLQDKNPIFNKIIFKGTACHFNKYLALEKALLEALQTKTGVISGMRDDLSEDDYLYSWNGSFSSEIDAVDFSEINTYEVEITSQVEFIKNLLTHYSRDLLYYIYHDSQITVLKSFIL